MLKIMQEFKEVFVVHKCLFSIYGKRCSVKSIFNDRKVHLS